MLVSVIIPGYNHAPYLRERIESVLKIYIYQICGCQRFDNFDKQWIKGFI